MQLNESDKASGKVAKRGASKPVSTDSRPKRNSDGQSRSPHLDVDSTLNTSASDRNSENVLTRSEISKLPLPSEARLPTLLKVMAPSRLYHFFSAGRIMNIALSGSANYDYWRRYSNKAPGRPVFTPRVKEELSLIRHWMLGSDPLRCKCAFVGVGYFITDPEDRGGKRRWYSTANHAFAHMVMSYYQDAFKEDADVSAALTHAIDFYRSGRAHYGALAWWMIGNVAAHKNDREGLCKALQEAIPMNIVARSLPGMFYQGEDNYSLNIQAAKESMLLENEQLIPSFDFRVEAKPISHKHIRSSPAAFFEVKRIEWLIKATDIKNVVKNALNEKVTKTFTEPNGDESSLGAHYGRKVLVIQSPWPEEGVPFTHTSKNRYTKLKASGKREMGYYKDGRPHKVGQTSLFKEIAEKLTELDPEGKLDAVYLTSHQGELLQTFFHSGTKIDEGVVITGYRKGNPVKWTPHGTEQISPWSYLLAGATNPHSDFIEGIRHRGREGRK